MTDADYTDELALLANTPAQAESQQYRLEQAAESIGLFMCFKQKGVIFTFIKSLSPL